MKKNKGFSLLELLVVIAIIGILSAVGVANYMEVRKKARDSKRIADLKAISEALELYRQSQDPPAYPTAPLPTPCRPWQATINGKTIVFMNSIPGDPVPDGCTVRYYYARPNSLDYTLAACMEAKDSGPNITDINPGVTPPEGISCVAYYVLEP